MKNYKYTKIKRTNFIIENDITNPTVDPKINLLLTKIKNMESGSRESTEDFLNCLKLNFGITNISDLNAALSRGCANVSSNANNKISGLGSSVIKAIKFALQLVEKFLKKVDPKYVGGYVAGAATVGLVVGGFSFFTIMAMSIIASCAAMVFFKIYKVIKKTDISESVRPFIIKHDAINVLKSTIETDLVFNKLCRIIESEYLTTDSSAVITIDNIITRSYSICKDMLLWIRDKVSKAFVTTSNFVERNPKFITIILFCIGLVMAYSGCSSLKTKLFGPVTTA